MNKKWTKRKKARKKVLNANRHSCKRKVSHETVEEAWEVAASFYIKKQQFTMPYKCMVCGKFHNTSNVSLGDMSHIPMKYRPLFVTINHPETVEGTNFWTKLRIFLGVQSKHETTEQLSE